MTNTELIWQDQIKKVYQVFYDGSFPEWVFLTDSPKGWGCLTKQLSDGHVVLSDMFHGISWADPTCTLVAVVPNKRIDGRPHEIYGLLFSGSSLNGLTCYAEEMWDLRLQEVLARMPDLYQVPLINTCARRFAIPALIFPPDQVEKEFNNAKKIVVDELTKKLKTPTIFGYLQRESLYYWAIGIENKKNLRIWLPISLLWNKISSDPADFAQQLVDAQRLDMFSCGSDRATVILYDVIKPFCKKHRIDVLAEKNLMQEQFSALQHWLAEKLMQQMTDCFVKAWNNE